MNLSEKERFDWMIGKGWTADADGQVWSHKGKPVGTVRKRDGYVQINMRLENRSSGSMIMRAHRFVFYFLTGEIPEQVDHINRFKHDNRIENLRSVTHQQNQFNTDAKGYYLHKCGRWMAYIKANGIRIHLGLHDTEEEARDAYLAAKAKYHKIPEPNH